MTNDLAAIEAVLQTYFDGLHEGSVEKLGAAFHETADLRSVAADGTLAVLTRAAWFDGGASPARRRKAATCRATTGW